jgi:Cof subfamily protein (haloacid dehalogenase superfamily)
VIQQSTLPLEVAREVLDFLLLAGLDVWVYRDADWFIRKREAPHVDREQWTVKFEPTVTKALSSVLERAVKIVGVSDDHGLVERTEAALRKRVAGHASAARSQPYYLDVTHPNANKGEVVLTMSKFLNIPIEQIATIGDMPNDVLMFRKSGVSIAMGNASPEVQKSATYVTSSNEQEGFATAMEKFILTAPK